MEVLSETTKVTTYKTRVLSVDKFKVTESYIDGKLVGQAWSIDGGFKTTHPDAYEADNLRFSYYEDSSFVDSDVCSDSQDFWDLIPEPTLITDWDSVNLDNVICVWTSMDGNIYRITDPDPIEAWHSKNYIGGFANDRYNLPKLFEKLKKTDGIRNARIEKIPYYNCDKGHTNGIYLEYKARKLSFDFSEGFSKKFFDLKEFEV